MSKFNYGEVIIATPATHIVQLESEESFGTDVLKGYSNGLLSFKPIDNSRGLLSYGRIDNRYSLVNSEGEEIGIHVRSWGYYYPYLGVGFPTTNLYIECGGWFAFEIDVTNSPVWESWLSHFHPQENETVDKKNGAVQLPTLNLPTPKLEATLVGPLVISIDISMCTPPVIDQISKILKSYPGDREVNLQLKDGHKSTILKLDDALKVTYSSSLSDNLKTVLGPECLSV
jgi:hypothetical protein